MLTDLAKNVLSDSGVDLNANDHIESHVFLLLIEKLRARVGAEMVDATLDEIIKYFLIQNEPRKTILVELLRLLAQQHL